MDSFSQAGPSLNDNVQQQHWLEETEKLWFEASNRNQSLDFKTIDEVLEDNARCKEENEYLNIIIDEEISSLKEEIKSLSSNMNHIGDNISYIGSRVTMNTKDINDNDDDISSISSRIENISIEVDDNKEASAQNSANIATLKSNGKISTPNEKELRVKLELRMKMV